MNEKDALTLSQASKQLGVKTATLRWLCNSGMIPGVRRDRSGYRVLNDWQINHAKMILQLRTAGVSKIGLKRYVKLFRQGSVAISQRKALLETWRRQFWQEVEDLQQGIDAVERQIELLDGEGSKVKDF